MKFKQIFRNRLYIKYPVQLCRPLFIENIWNFFRFSIYIENKLKKQKKNFETKDMQIENFLKIVGHCFKNRQAGDNTTLQLFRKHSPEFFYEEIIYSCDNFQKLMCGL